MSLKIQVVLIRPVQKPSNHNLRLFKSLNGKQNQKPKLVF